MKLHFLNRNKEKALLKNFFDAPTTGLVVIYGRRRCGKSRLLQEVFGLNCIYCIADQQEQALQRRAIAKEISRLCSGFENADYPTWDSLFSALNNRQETNLTLIIDEFPYLVQTAPELPSIIQKHIDQQNGLRFKTVLCGSSQRMMQGLVLDSTAPLYGRASEIIKIRPLAAGWIQDALNLKGSAALEAYSVWGGVPRYWEQASRFSSLDDALRNLVYDRDGLFHLEPQRLLIDEMRSSVQPHSLLELIANGANRISEIAARLSKHASGLSRPIDNLIDLGYIKRETPYGVEPRKAKRSIYKVADPFLLFWYRCVQPNMGLLEQDLIDSVVSLNKDRFKHHVAEIWEELARSSVSQLRIGGIDWMPAQRYWGNDIKGEQLEVDIVAKSLDGSYMLFGEVKSGSVEPNSILKNLQNKAARSGLLKNEKAVYAYWSPEVAEYQSETDFCINANNVLNCLR
jgi:AAA+ ATPase superfamily predicted ATPase